MLGFPSGSFEKMSKPELPREEIMDVEGNLFWHGKKFSRSHTGNEITIARGELSEFEIKAFEQDLQKKFPAENYAHVMPFKWDKFEVFLQGEGKQIEKKQDGNEHDNRLAA